MKVFWQRYGYWIRWIVSTGLLAVVVSQVDLQMMSGLFVRLDWWYYPTGLLLALLSNIFASKRWHLFVPVLRFQRLYRVNLVANYYAFLSGTAVIGDLLKLGHIGNRQSLQGEVVASIIVDKALALVGSSVTLMLGVLASDQALRDGLLPSATLFAGFCVGFLSLVSLPAANDVVENVIDGLSFRYHFIASRQIAVKRALRQVHFLLSSRSRVAAALVYTVLFNLTLACIYSLWSVLFQIQLSPGSYIVVCVWAQVAAMIPLGVAGLGLRDVTTVALLVRLGIEESTAALATLSFYPLVILVAALGYLLSISPNQRPGEINDEPA